MPLIPLSFLFSLLCLALLWRLGWPSLRYGIGQLLLLVCAWQGLLVGIRYGYQFNQLNMLQPLGAVMIPSLTYLALQVTAKGRLGWRAGLHLLPMLLVAMALLWAPFVLDITIVVCYLAYGAAVLFYVRGGENCLQQVRLTESWLSIRLWRSLGMLLIACGIAEFGIALDFWLFAGRHAGLLATVGNILVMASICLALSRSGASQNTSDTLADDEVPNKEDQQQAESWFGQVEQRLRQDNLYLEADLNLARLARKVGLPARKVSLAVNQQTGMNVSQYVNQLRIQQASEWLSSSDRPVTEIMLEAGFSTKSNFNREFLRVQGMSPSEWRKLHPVDP
ncbi:helix-turn-helix domain-containing protein [Serratia aquatilis]|uniref:Helix-turn-helix domain-containing protein n=1 Tax=Serratia aquatilis TaxID=1737515 RepID=A0ABV6E7U8_9GAMM